ncbi:hypothetical protein B0I31_1142 [Saccharothrix carnea]|uniref:Uncharacterized protein n=1 Tax=Saccharothrix carnea TaxID=1280637 RepID=A0A2P8I133_SACCR|nr:hypothetical protein [Saccharothrix carnea]PSL52175.1 hypothetical protein B0I31_1142 [Saccharothrix carnea]
MSDEVRDMIKAALADEPASGLEFERVVQDGRKRRARRRFGVLTTAAVGVVAVAAVAVSGTVASSSAPPASVLSTSPTSVTSSVAPAPGCAAPAGMGGFPDQPRGSATPEELAESARLTEAFAGFALPLPAGVEATPLRLCAIDASWGGDFGLTGDRTVIVYVRPLGRQPPGECRWFTPETQCSVRALPDGSTARVTVEPGSEATLATADVWRGDGTYVSVMETGGTGSKNRVLTDDQLVAVATAPQLKVQWVGRAVPADPSNRRAAELDQVLAGALPPGLTVERHLPSDEAALRFRVSQGGYRAAATVTDAEGRGSVMVTVDVPRDGEPTCRDRSACRVVELAGGRKATVETTTEDGLIRRHLYGQAADGSRLTVQSSNVADMGPAADRPTRPTPPLTEADLIRIAELPGLHW